MQRRVRIDRGNAKHLPTRYRPNFKIFKMNWDFHKFDDDPSPSVPHGHSIDNKYRLSIWDGEVYEKKDGKLNRVGKAKKKDLEDLRKDIKFQAFVLEARDWYEKNHRFCPPLSDNRQTAAARELYSGATPDSYSVTIKVEMWDGMRKR